MEDFKMITLSQDEKWPNYRDMAGQCLMPRKYHLALYFWWMLPNDGNINKLREREEGWHIMVKYQYCNQPQVWDETKDVGGLGNDQSNNQIFWGKWRAQTGGGDTK